MTGAWRTLLRRLGQAVLWLVATIFLLWSFGAWWFCMPIGPVLAVLAALGIIFLTVTRGARAGARWLGVYFLVGVFALGQLEPQSDANWAQDIDRLARVRWDGDVATITGIRDATYTTPEDFTLAYADERIDIRTVRSIDFVVERFHDLDALAHTLLSFGFEDGRHLSISAEIRREEGEEFSPFAGLYRQFEMVYVVGTERDLIGLRTHHRKSRVWLYPIRTTQERMEDLLRAMLERSQRLIEAPEFYNTLTSTCATNIVDHVLELKPDRIPFDLRMVFPGHAGAYAHELGLLDTDLPFASAEALFRIDELARERPIGADFSTWIRSRRTVRAPHR